MLARKEGFDVFVSDLSKISDKYKQLLNSHQIEWEEGQHTEEKILSADEVIKSPGIPDKAPMIVKIKERAIPIISEIEFAARYTRSKMVCITDITTGKTYKAQPFPPFIQNIIKAGGLLKSLKEAENK